MYVEHRAESVTVEQVNVVQFAPSVHEHANPTESLNFKQLAFFVSSVADPDAGSIGLYNAQLF